MKIVLAPIFIACLTAAAAQAQTATPSAPAAVMVSPQAAAPVANPIATSLRIMLPNRQKNILGAIEAMPADKFSYKPTPDQISFAHLVVHITESNNAMCAKIADIPEPKVDKIADTDPKDKLLAAARASFDFCSATLAKLDDSKLGDSLDFGRFQAPRAMATFFLAGGWADHYAAAAMYLRLNGILPPSAPPKK